MRDTHDLHVDPDLSQNGCLHNCLGLFAAQLVRDTHDLHVAQHMCNILHDLHAVPLAANRRIKHFEHLHLHDPHDAPSNRLALHHNWHDCHDPHVTHHFALEMPHAPRWHNPRHVRPLAS